MAVKISLRMSSSSVVDLFDSVSAEIGTSPDKTAANGLLLAR